MCRYLLVLMLLLVPISASGEVINDLVTSDIPTIPERYERIFEPLAQRLICNTVSCAVIPRPMRRMVVQPTVILSPIEEQEAKENVDVRPVVASVACAGIQPVYGANIYGIHRVQYVYQTQQAGCAGYAQQAGCAGYSRVGPLRRWFGRLRARRAACVGVH